MLTASVFAVAHGYGAAGLLDVFWSGLVWAWAYERTRSVIPGVVAHAVTNLLVSVGLLALLR
jgi:membrane protease YdiL (CAAX protease family)